MYFSFGKKEHNEVVSSLLLSSNYPLRIKPLFTMHLLTFVINTLAKIGQHSLIKCSLMQFNGVNNKGHQSFPVALIHFTYTYSMYMYVHVG